LLAYVSFTTWPETILSTCLLHHLFWSNIVRLCLLHHLF
jgi:hypothetical protein